MKHLLIALCTILWMGAANAQTVNLLPNNEIARVIELSKEANLANGVIDPDKIFPGDSLTFLFTDGFIGGIIVAEGDNQWKILKEKLSDLTAEHGEVVDYNEAGAESGAATAPQAPQPTVNNVTNVYDSKPSWLPWLILASLLFTGVSLFAFWKLRKNRDVNPAEAGPAHRQGGIRIGSENEHEHAVEAFRSQYGNNSSVITNVRRVLLSTRGNSEVPVRFSNGTTQNFRFQRRRGYQALVDGQVRFVLGECANAFGAPGQQMAGENLIVEELDAVPVPQATTETPAQQEQIQPAIVQVISAAVEKMTNGGQIEFQHNGATLNIWVNAKQDITVSSNGQVRKEEKPAAEVVS